MGKATKYLFDRESKVTATYDIEDASMGKMIYDGGKFTIISEGFETIVSNVDELEVTLKPLDILMNKMSFKLVKDGEELKISQSFFGVKKVNLDLIFDESINGETF